MKGKAPELFNDTEKKSLRRLEIYWFTTVDTVNKKEDPLKLKGVSLTTDLVECFYNEAKYVKRRKYADGILCCQHDEGLNWHTGRTQIPWDWKQWK